MPMVSLFIYCIYLAGNFILQRPPISRASLQLESKDNEGRSSTKCLTRGFVWRFIVSSSHWYLVKSLFCEFFSSIWFLVGLVDSSFYECDSLLTKLVCRLSFCRFIMTFYSVSMWRFIVSIMQSPTQRGYNSTYITWSTTWFHALTYIIIHWTL